MHRADQPATTSLSLVDRVKKGDHEAFSMLLEKYRRRLAIFIHYRLGPELRRWAEVDDVLQETLLEAFGSINQFAYRHPGSFLSWLMRIAEHVIADLARSQGRLKRRANEIVGFRSESNPSGPEPVDSKTPSRLLRQAEALKALLERLDALPEDYRRVILLAKIEGLSTQQVADRLGRSREAAAVLLHRAIKRFQELEMCAAKSKDAR